MQILLTTLNAKYIHLNLAVRLLYDLNKDYTGLAWKEFTIKEDKDAVANYCKTYDVVCFSCYIWNITQTLEVAHKIKERNPNTKILLGGPEVSYDWHDVIAQDQVDFIITGEGEIPFANFLKTYPNIDLVPNLIRKVNGEIIYHQQAVEFDLKHFENTNPYANEPSSELENKVCYIETSRGCPYKCEFCLASLDNKVRYLPDAHIKSNLLYLMKHGKTIKFLDRTFNIKKDFTIDMFKFILEHHRPENIFQFEITADIVHPDIIKFIDDHVPHGLFRFEIGIQTVNQKANLEVSRKQNFEKTSGIIKSLQHKIEMHLDLIVGLPLDYWEDNKYSFEEVFKLFPPELQLGFLKFLKGTPVREKYEQYGYVFDPMPPYQIIKSDFLSEVQLHQITLVENALEIYWNKKRAFYTLQYITMQYSIFDFLLGLGTYFKTKKEFHQYALKDVYEILYEFIQANYGDDVVLKELVTIDYYLQYKIKPQSLFIAELPKKNKFELLESLQLNHHKYRYVVLPISFDFSFFQKTRTIQLQQEHIIIQYSGTTQSIVVSNGLLTQPLLINQ
jgi:anaerobic magnesium-protoporphyrin IX monomethyl ester cyclase